MAWGALTGSAGHTHGVSLLKSLGIVLGPFSMSTIMTGSVEAEGHWSVMGPEISVIEDMI
ncbi:hypothetical protein ColLi_03664 [Colletotrichum liriopes]|uniref:Uncharacterized protein n=1 Tax=Colletotrichum liriopes TaxID=708192 RepID=A0AA37GI65_9PEZI|nr:hypothetical protein ColLi_03664 [Colletotrichum liriopes]